jgi:hypothetical protein
MNFFAISRRFGRGGVIRTRDPLRPRQVRYQAALRPDKKVLLILSGSHRYMSARNFEVEMEINSGVDLRRRFTGASPKCGITHRKSPRILPSRVARAPFTDNSFSSRPRSASIVTSVSVTSTVPFIPELKNPILAMNEKKRVEPCQLLCSFAICSGRVLVPRNRSSKERSTACITSSLDLLWETVTRTRAIPHLSLV